MKGTMRARPRNFDPEVCPCSCSPQFHHLRADYARLLPRLQLCLAEGILRFVFASAVPAQWLQKISLIRSCDSSTRLQNSRAKRSSQLAILDSHFRSQVKDPAVSCDKV